MWPFTSRRIFGNRWWALAFAAIVCWRAVEFVQDFEPAKDQPAPSAQDQAAAAEAEAQLRKAVEALEAVK